MDVRRKLHQQRIMEINDWIGKLEERDTEQQAFVHLIQILPKLTSAQAYEMYSRLEKNKDPPRSSTREDIVLLMGALCKQHPRASARYLTKMVSYLNYRLRDKRQKVTDACMKACASISLYVLPSLPQIKIDLLIQPFLKETNVLSDGAAKCIGAMLHPSTEDSLMEHATRITSYLGSFFPHILSRFHSVVHSTYSPIFYILTEILRLAKKTHQDLKDMCASSFEEILVAVDSTMQFSQRDDWVNRKRSLDLLIECLLCFPNHSNISMHASDLKQLAEKGRSDYASPVRESAAKLLALLLPYDTQDTTNEHVQSTAQIYSAAHPRPATSPKSNHYHPLSSPQRKQSPLRDSFAFKHIREERIYSPRASFTRGNQEERREELLSGDYAENMNIAMEEGYTELALRIALLSEDKTLIRRWLCFSQPSMQYFRETTVNALCASFLDFLDNVDDAALIFPWISCMLRDESLLKLVDLRIARDIEDLLADLSLLPTREGLIAARLHHELECHLEGGR